MSNPSRRNQEFCRICLKEIQLNDEVENVRLSLLDPTKYLPLKSNNSYPDVVHKSCFKREFEKEWKHYSRDGHTPATKKEKDAFVLQRF